MHLSTAANGPLEWHIINTHSTLLRAVARVSSRLFLGDRLCRDPEWLTITTTYTYHVTTAVHELNAWPSLLRPLVYRYLPRIRELRRQVRKAHTVMGKVLKERAALVAKGEAPEYIDAIEWFKQVANGRKYDPVHVQLSLSFVAIHTTADMVTQLMFDLAEHSELIQPLREEIVTVLGSQGWKKTSLYNMKLLDSVLKEVQRLRPINESKTLFAAQFSNSLIIECKYFAKPLTAFSLSTATCHKGSEAFRWHSASAEYNVGCCFKPPPRP